MCVCVCVCVGVCMGVLVPTHKTDRLQRLQNQCARILTKSPRREYIIPVKKTYIGSKFRIESHIKY